MLSNKEPSGKQHIALEIFQDLDHIRRHTLLHAYHAEAPQLALRRIPILEFAMAMSSNTHSAHPVRDSIIDVAAEHSVLTTMGLSIGNGPAGIALLASHLAESGLDRFPSWDAIDKMPKSSTIECYAYSRMIEARATAELLAMPSKTVHTLSHFVKSVLDNKTEQTLTIKPTFNPTLPTVSTQLAFASMSPPKPSFESPKLIALSDNAMPKSAWKPHTEPSKMSFPTKFTGLALGNEPKTAWDLIKQDRQPLFEATLPSHIKLNTSNDSGLRLFSKPSSTRSSGLAAPFQLDRENPTYSQPFINAQDLIAKKTLDYFDSRSQVKLNK